MAESCTKYRMYRKQRKVSGTNDWEDVIPYQYSIDGDGTQPLIEIEVASADCCGQDPDTGDTPSVGDIKWEVVSNNYYCTGTTKVEMLQKYQWNGTQWMPLEEYQMGDVIEYNSTDCGYIPEPHDYSQDYFTTVALGNGHITFKPISDFYRNMSYSVDNGNTWTTMSSSQVSVPVASGDRVMWKGTPRSSAQEVILGMFSATTASFEAEGNAMSLLYGDNFQEYDYFVNVPTLRHLFNGCVTLTNAENLVLSPTIWTTSCYQYMFSGCTNLITAPSVLPATTLTDRCYQGMFARCTSLTAVPELPATTLADNCYEGMFSGCTNLRTTPALPATSLTLVCYASMFKGCTSLTTAPALPATTLSANCYSSMFSGCTNLVTPPAILPSCCLKEACYKEMFAGCTRLASAPEIPALDLAAQCCYGMFSGCTSLVTAPELPATVLPTSFTAFASECYSRMFYGCTSLRTPPSTIGNEDTEFTSSSGCSYMFYGCTSLTTAPALPAKKISSYTYYRMFQGCTNLNSITCLATGISASNCTTNWTNGVAATGTFRKAASMSDWTTGASGIPNGWTVVDYTP